MYKISLDDFVHYNFLSEVKMSPDGKGAAYLVSWADEEENGYLTDLYWIENLCSDAMSIRLTATGRVKSFIWMGKNLAYTEYREADAGHPYGTTEIYSVSRYGTEPEKLCTAEGLVILEGELDSGRLAVSRVDNIAHQQALQGLTGSDYEKECARLKQEEKTASVFDEYPFWFNGIGTISKRRRTVYLLNTQDGTMERLTPFGFRTRYICVEGARILYSGGFVEPVEDDRMSAWMFEESSGETVCILPEKERHVYAVCLSGGKAVLVSSKMDRYSVAQCPDILLIDPKDGSRRVLCDYTREINVGNPVASDCRLGGGYVIRAYQDKLYFIMGVADASHLYSCDLQGNVECVFAKDGSIDCFDIQNGRIAMIAMHDMRLQELYALEKSAEAVRCTSWNDDFYLTRPPIMPEKCNFINQDGVEIHGFVIKPADYKAGNSYPAILDIHGGPHLSYGAVYYHEMQYWAQHGYFVIYCNPRGGEGRGNEFGMLCGRFGTIDYEDLMAFCDHVLEEYPAIDHGRMGVTGGSYGGYMTNWIIGHTDRFAAAVSQRGISNFVSMEGTSDIGTSFAQRQVMASTHTDIAKMWDSSPLKYADRCVTPTLFIHAEQDYRCWMVEALQMYTALIHHGVRTRLCLFHNENHDLSRSGRPGSRIRRLREITDWMDEFLKPEENTAVKSDK
ncbi:MAG: S9 family peptidase [Lachnospiraceae bacterium]|nr:S9 family peptidase [Lachnospiraceae bacterium]